MARQYGNPNSNSVQSPLTQQSMDYDNPNSNSVQTPSMQQSMGYDNPNSNSVQSPSTQQSMGYGNQTLKILSIILILCALTGLIIIGSLAYFVFFNGGLDSLDSDISTGISHSNLNVESIGRVCKSMGYSEMSVDEMVDIMNSSDHNPTGYYFTTESKSDLKRLAKYGCESSIALYGINRLAIGGQSDWQSNWQSDSNDDVDDNYTFEFEYAGYKTDKTASEYVEYWLSVNNLDYVAQKYDWVAQAYEDKSSPFDVSETVNGTSDGISYYFIHYVICGFDNMYCILYSGTDVCVLKSVDVPGMFKGQQRLNDMCEALHVISPSEAFDK